MRTKIHTLSCMEKSEAFSSIKDLNIKPEIIHLVHNEHIGDRHR